MHDAYVRMAAGAMLPSLLVLILILAVVGVRKLTTNTQSPASGLAVAASLWVVFGYLGFLVGFSVLSALLAR